MILLRALPALLLPILLVTLPTGAHEARPAFLEIAERGAGQYDVTWKRPARGDRVLALTPRLEPACASAIGPLQSMRDGASVQRWTMDCGATGIGGRALRIEGLEGTLTDALVRIAHASGELEQALLRPSSPTYDIAGTRGTLEVAADYARLGVEHILLGFDHLLFVLGLLLLVRRVGPLIGTVTALTLAHSLTLALATLGVVHVPSAPVEAAIALSIAYLAAEVLHVRQGRPGLTARMPWLVAFAFGLLHGLGFAGALREVGLPEHEIPTALLFFNVGVEIGQLLLIGACLGLARAARQVQLRTPGWAPAVPAYAIGSLAALWSIERAISLL